MKLSFDQLAVISALLTSSHAAALPTDALASTLAPSDGIYTIHLNSKGEQEHHFVRNLTEADFGKPDALSASNKLATRDPNWPGDTGITCDNRNYLWNNDLWAWPYQALNNFCAEYGKISKANNEPAVGGYAMYGNAMGYWCSYHSDSCNQDEVLHAWEWISSACKQGTNGWQEAGKLYTQTWQKEYGMNNPSQRWEICNGAAFSYPYIGSAISDITSG